MERARTLVSTGILALVAAGASAAEVPIAVSPGHVSGVALVEHRCPTFSWGEVAGAKSYQLVVYGLGDEGEEARPVLQRAFPGSVDSWTPSLEGCLERGGRYAWSVRALGAWGASEWSAPSLFAVESGPSDAEFEAALKIVQAYLAKASSREADAEPAIEPDAEAAPEDTSSSSGETALVLVEAPAQETAAEASPAFNPDALAAIAMTVDGTVSAGGFSGDGSGLNSVTASNLSCSGCVGSGDLGSNSVYASEIATGAVGKAEIGAGAVGGSEIGDIRYVRVECAGGCADITLGQACASISSAWRPLFVDCDRVDDTNGFDCPDGNGNNKCIDLLVTKSLKLSQVCNDQSGWDASVYCMHEGPG